MIVFYTMPRSMFMHVCLHEATHMYVRVCAYICECESYKSPKYKDVFKKDYGAQNETYIED